MQIGRTSRKWPNDGPTTLNRAQSDSGWMRRRPISYADDIEGEELHVSMRGWQKAEPTTLRVDKSIEDVKHELMVAIVDDYAVVVGSF